MHIGLMIRKMGDQSTREIMAGAALAAKKGNLNPSGW
ncbi:MAG: hypothetical protein Ct9H300mP20_20940 [Gammaproteobacteria bacterium]|nr:MAG: hypothetical protein Ct9H300mP20_20940 [Gammaproteobacteria bacterium]